MIKWADLDADSPGEPLVRGKEGRMPLQCLCGRFAKYVGDRHYYNGQFNCYSYTVRCSRCGDVTIECV